MRLCTVTTEATGPFFGIELGARILRIAGAMEALDINAADRAAVATLPLYLGNLPKSEKLLRALLQQVAGKPRDLLRKPPSDGLPVLIETSKVRFLPPIQRPGKILCIGLNYRDHCAEQAAELPKFPVVFNKFATSLLAHGDAIPLPLRRDEAVDYEAELAVVIGKRASRVSKRTALRHVAGYTVMNDISLRTLQAREKQWARAKGFDGSAPCGPVVVTCDEIPDPQQLKLTTRVNKHLMQNGHTSGMIFGVAALIAFITELITLEPGDIIATGTPAGVGRWRNPPVYLRPGDTVEVEVERVGTLRNTCERG